MIGYQVWQDCNLSVRHFRNGDAIPLVESNEEWERMGHLFLPACCYYRNDSAFSERTGLLYNWFAVADPRCLAPTGMRLPALSDWLTMSNFCGGAQVAGFRLKSDFGWNYDGSGADTFGFRALPGGGRGAFGTFLDYGDYGNWWCADWTNGSQATFVYISFLDGHLHLRKDGFKMSGFSVRCLKE